MLLGQLSEACVPQGIGRKWCVHRAGKILGKTLHYILSGVGGRKRGVHKFPVAMGGEQALGAGVGTGRPSKWQ